MTFDLSVKIDGWNEFRIFYEEQTYDRLIFLLEAFLTEIKQKQKDLK